MAGKIGEDKDGREDRRSQGWEEDRRDQGSDSGGKITIGRYNETNQEDDIQSRPNKRINRVY